MTKDEVLENIKEWASCYIAETTSIEKGDKTRADLKKIINWIEKHCKGDIKNESIENQPLRLKPIMGQRIW